ncbi:hypothetical protein BV22DRAFT_1051260 [Leucogyrophana mollusca]|uniref:Uncharacterized protein n=1 Tax=Leucogyrophana mollusca TaxID=85980 RepID=A0ACB8B1N1_9AGAM|nr:hypothetical protein BV22DRAFT_1051260 [Leucogyrophana mollusca]
MRNTPSLFMQSGVNGTRDHQPAVGLSLFPRGLSLGLKGTLRRFERGESPTSFFHDAWGYPMTRIQNQKLQTVSVVGVRVVGFFLKDFWDHSHLGFGSTPYKRLVRDINSCNAVDSPGGELAASSGSQRGNHCTRPSSQELPRAPLFPEVKEKGYAATSFAISSLLGLDEQVRGLLGGQTNFPGWLANTYDICSPNDEILEFYEKPPRRVTFQVDPNVVAECEKEGISPPDLPDRTLIAIRSACTRVAHLSGSAEQMDQVQQDMEATMVLANDGSTADLLGSLLPHHIECKTNHENESYLRGT